MNFCSRLKKFETFSIIENVVDENQIQIFMDYWVSKPVGVVTEFNKWDNSSPTKTKIIANNRVVEIIGIQKQEMKFLSDILYESFSCITENFDLEYPHYFTYYPLGGKHTPHRDFSKKVKREWVLTLLLNDNFEGGDLIVGGNYTPKKKGSIIIFDCNILHEVTPVQLGERFVITECAKKI
jgi:predicted 2-oxoglutarate/Fe(II)-dependent dioxygenase YbiX